MPEGDTVWRTARALDRALAGANIAKADLRVPAHATADLAEMTVVSVSPRGKHLLMAVASPASARADGASELVFHTTLGMDGKWRIYRHGEVWRGGPGHAIRAVVEVQRHVAVGYWLPTVELFKSAEAAARLAHLGPDLLGDDWDSAEALRRMTRDGDRPIGEVLLDQRCLAGIGNVYKSEICFLQNVAPQTAVGKVPDLPSVILRAHQLLNLNKARANRVTTGDSRRPLWVYGRARMPCRRCGTSIRVSQEGHDGRQRWTWWCPRCQPAVD
ncbi:MAG: DNA-formamidopyrimidine glycosylase family protein [Candidatus Nanopelagicales bacterium]